VTDPNKKKARKRAKKPKRQELGKALEATGKHAREKKKKSKR
jgi:hypothetical protein